MTEGAGNNEISPQTERMAAERARDRATNARWSLEIAVFLFAILIMVIILATYTQAGLEIVAPIAIIGLAMVWVIGWRRGKQLYQRFYDEEITKLEEDFKKTLVVKETVEETIEEKVQKALRQRWR
jgi:ABC-type multidrug transport system fused ATPase/permease subunit